MKIKGRIIKSAFSFAIILAMVSAMPGLVKANNENTGSADLKVDYHTKYEIANYIQSHPTDKAYTNSYSSTPNASSPYAIGRLSDDVLNGSLELLNTFRYIAGVPSNVTLNETYIEKAQAAALVDAANDELTHNPTQPSDMSSAIYSVGKEGAKSSNLGAGYRSIGDAILTGWMSDSDPYNIDRVGHRRWVLNPAMAQTGFGIAKKTSSSYYGYYSAMYAHDSGNSSAGNYNVVAWPAQNTPTGYFFDDDAWSLSFNEYIDTANVTVTCVNTGQSWTLNGTNDCMKSSGNGYININNAGYGQKGCIIFRPDSSVNVSKNYSYNVSVSGQMYNFGWVKHSDGYLYWEKTGAPVNYSLSYTVDFFDINDYKLNNSEKAKVTLVSNGGTGAGEYYYLVKNSTYGEIPTPVRAGYRFLGWFTAAEGGVKIESTDVCTGNITLYAQWTDQAPYTVEHYTENLSGVYVKTSTDTLYGKINSMLSDCSKSFEGFGHYNNKDANDGYIRADGSTVLKFYYPRNSYELSWDLNGGSLPSSASYSEGTTKYDASISAPIPTKTGYSFKGWNPSFTGKMPAADTKYVAVWEAREIYYDIEYYKEKLDGGYTLSKVLSKGAPADSEVTPDVLNFEGFTSPEPQKVIIKSDSSTVVKYYYKRNSYKLTWDFDGGTASGNYTPAGTYKYETSIVKPYPSKPGYTFTGWNVNVSYMPAYNLTLKAVYKVKDNPYYNVEHYKQNPDGTYNSTPDEKDLFKGTSGASVTPETKTYTGFTSPSVQTVQVKSDGTTVVKYKYERKKYLLTWDLDGGSAEGTYTSGNVRYGAEIIPPVPTKKGYEFYDWDIYAVPKTMPAKNLTVKALWRAVNYSVTVTFDVNGGKALTNSTKTIRAFTAYGELPSTTRTGYTFTGWYTAKSGGTKVTAESICEGDTTLYAHWKAKTNTKYTVEHYRQKLDGTYNETASETDYLTGKTNASVTPAVKEYKGFTAPETQTVKIKANGSLVVKYYYERNSYTLKWNFDGGSADGTYTKGSVKYGAKIKQPVPTKKGYTFAGWDKTVPEKMPAKNLTVKALWTANYATVTFNVNGGKALSETTKAVQENTAYGELPTTSRTGYTFSGWYTEKSGGTKITAESICEGDITLYARWKAKKNTSYKVEHYKQKLNGNYNKTASDTETFTGKTNSSVTPEVKTYKGFTSPELQTVKIKADGTLVVKYYYTRNSYKLTWDFAGGSAKGSYTKGSIKYGTAITSPTPVKDGYVFTGWDKEVPEKMPAKNLKLTATWKKADQKQVSDFVNRFYTSLLGKSADAEGLKYWSDKLTSKKITGAEFVVSIINTADFKKRNLSDKEYVTILYKAFFGREADPDGVEYWCNELKRGKTRDYVLQGFVNSAEFNALCKEYGIDAGRY